VDVLHAMLPGRISTYLFEPNGQIRLGAFDVSPLRQIIAKHRNDLLHNIQEVFQQGWPKCDQDVTSLEVLTKHVDSMARQLDVVLHRLRKRLQWAHNEIRRLNNVKDQFGTLDSENDAHYRRCDRLIKKLKGIRSRTRREAEGVNDINTYGVLAAEGFLPGYGLDTGSVVGMAEVPFWQLGSMDFDLPRPTSIALREYVPGNLIYANGHKFVTRRFHREVGEDRNEVPIFEVNIEREAVMETNVSHAASSMASETLRTISVCDVDLVHKSQISDEEETRFQMPVSVYGRESGHHNGGYSYIWGEKQITFRHNVHLRMVNVGSTPVIEQRQLLGYPICTICGQSVSPLASDRQLKSFEEGHEKRCGRKPEMLGLYADVVCDCISLPSCASRMESYSILESLRMGATQILDMHLEDLQLLVIGYVDRDEVDALLWDPMPGGSGLLDQLCDRFTEVVSAAKSIVSDCPSHCDHSCIDCLQTFRNSYYHKYLDRHVSLASLQERGEILEYSHDIPSSQSADYNTDIDAQPVNNAETKLKHLLASAGFSSGHFQEHIRFKKPIELDHRIGSTTPDVFFKGDEDDEDDKGICIYLDGMSTAIHGDPGIESQDREIRSWLRNNGYQVIEITFVELDDKHAMTRHFRKLAKYLSGRDLADRLSDNLSWFETVQD